ncbi:MAG: hypothetical protein NZ920_02245 [Aigarchaeota archaeon]|nr:hypothetical protein [Aigarchaeota archaeon]MDW8092553.1 hypothetical protein [Nitrososphaerota archaeon]
MRIEPLSQRELRSLEGELKRCYGIESLPKDLVFLAAGERKLKVSRVEVLEFSRTIRGVVNVGLYVVKMTRDGSSLSLEGSQLFGESIKKNLIELSESEVSAWMTGGPIIRTDLGDVTYVIAKFKNLYLGSGRVGRDGRVYPQIPKWRRVPENELD